MSSRFRRSIRILPRPASQPFEVWRLGLDLDPRRNRERQRLWRPGNRRASGNGFKLSHPSPSNRNVLPTDSDQTSKLMAMARRLKSKTPDPLRPWGLSADRARDASGYRGGLGLKVANGDSSRSISDVILVARIFRAGPLMPKSLAFGAGWPP